MKVWYVKKDLRIKLQTPLDTSLQTLSFVVFQTGVYLTLSFWSWDFFTDTNIPPFTHMENIILTFFFLPMNNNDSAASCLASGSFPHTL